MNGALRLTRPVWLLVVLFFVGGLRAAETIPPAPENHFNDYAGIVDRATSQRLNAELAQFERDTSNQILVAVYPRMESDSSVEDYTVRVAQQWGVGTKGKSNGAVLFVFQESHDIRVVTGYGLEGALPDALCKQIIENEIIPRFRRSDFTDGLSAGVRAMMAAARGEYTGTGRTAREAGRHPTGAPIGGVFFAIVVALMVLSGVLRRRRNLFYSPLGRRGLWVDRRGPWGGWGGGFGGGGGWSGGGGGTFSGGGGSFGGGGAGGKW